MASPFTRKTLAFLRALKRHNDRGWFHRRKDQYEAHVRGPMVQLLAQLAADLPAFAPELIADPRVSLYRIYRDTRFSEDKRPLKTHIAAHFPARGFARNEGAGLYLEVAPGWVWIGGGLYMPSSADLRAIREHIASHHRTLHRIVTSRPFRRAVGTLEGERLSRVPLGFPKDHPAAEYLRFKQFLAGCEFEAEFAASGRFYGTVLTIFRAVAPLVRFLNAPLLEAGPPTRVPQRVGVQYRRSVTPALPIEDGARLPDLRQGARRRPAPASPW
ncbi:MAG: DUF2461 domain-containing protein [Acidobacteria bacterium]|nr:DUF2461 domain-containing protein [Acidobacteriota bacterium]